VDSRVPGPPFGADNPPWGAGPAPWGPGPPPWLLAGGGAGCGPPAALDPADVPVDQLPVALLGAMRRFGPSWLRWLRAHMGGSGLTPARMQVLSLLARAAEPLIMRQLTQALGITARAVTGLVDALEAEGLVRREAHPTDRRATLVALTDAGRELIGGTLGQGMAAAAQVFTVLGEEDQRTLLGLLDRVTGALSDRLPDDAPAE
jgi:DNA-binding MarR family transcriptional regulator